jgi:BirA family biotin operon repressor/biotin-[acetyl-CoA-carboxylase] ligase
VADRNSPHIRPEQQHGASALSETGIRQAMKPAEWQRISGLEILAETDSTQEALLRLGAALRHGRVVLAERQTSGRGRRGRNWQSPQGNIFMSIGWHFDQPPARLGGLGPVVAIIVCEALQHIGLSGHGVKWPNDIQVHGKKLGGILVELRGGSSAVDAVIGIGINVHLNGRGSGKIDQPWTDLRSELGARLPARHVVAGRILDHLLPVLERGPGQFEAFLQDGWPQWDLLDGVDIHVNRDGPVVSGTANGITSEGALRVYPLSGNGEVMKFHSGEVSVRRA